MLSIIGLSTCKTFGYSYPRVFFVLNCYCHSASRGDTALDSFYTCPYSAKKGKIIIRSNSTGLNNDSYVENGIEGLLEMIKGV